jgi:serine/threonine-protein kinase
VAGRYRIIGRIGSGGMAEVYLARAEGEAGFSKEVAVKRILPSATSEAAATAMLIEEARLATRLNHANIVQVIDLGRAADRYFIVMEYVDGADLASVLELAGDHGRRLPPALAGHLVCELLAALRFAHARCDERGRPLGLVHRDVSPPNILLSRAGEVKLADFGIAKVQHSSLLTDAGVVRGKAGYMSPEQAAGHGLDARSDLFSLGVVLHELLTGRRLFAGDDPLAVLEQVCAARVAAPSVVEPAAPAALDPVVLRALAPEPADRFADARQFERALRRALDAAGLDAAASDLEAWLAAVLPPRRLDRPPASGDVLDLGAAAPAGTQPLPAPAEAPAAAAGTAPIEPQSPAPPEQPRPAAARRPPLGRLGLRLRRAGWLAAAVALAALVGLFGLGRDERPAPGAGASGDGGLGSVGSGDGADEGGSRRVAGAEGGAGEGGDGGLRRGAGTGAGAGAGGEKQAATAAASGRGSGGYGRSGFGDGGRSGAARSGGGPGRVQGKGRGDGGRLRAAPTGVDSGPVGPGAGTGTLMLNASPWARIHIDGRDTGVTTPTVAGLRLPAGRHRVELHNPELELGASFEVEIQAGETVKRFVDLRREGVQR